MNNLFNSYSFLQVTFIVKAQYFEKFWFRDCFTISKIYREIAANENDGYFCCDICSLTNYFLHRKQLSKHPRVKTTLLHCLTEERIMEVLPLLIWLLFALRVLKYHRR